MSTESRPPFPPFTLETAQKKVKAAQDLWNSTCVIPDSARSVLLWAMHTLRENGRYGAKPRFQRDPTEVSLGYTPDTIWRNRDTFLSGREEVVKFLTEKWGREHDYELRKELFAFTDNKVPVNSVDISEKHW